MESLITVIKAGCHGLGIESRGTSDQSLFKAAKARIEMKPQVEIVFQLWFAFMVLRRILEGVSLSVARKPRGPSDFFRQSSTTLYSAFRIILCM